MKATVLVAEPEAGRAGERRVRYGLRLAVGLGLIAWLLWQQGWHRILHDLAGVSPLWMALTVATYLAGQTLCAWKWGLLAGSQGFRRPPRFYWVNYLGAMFCSLFLPTSVGGDLFRAVALARPRTRGMGSDREGAVVSVLADRGTGVLAMTWIAALAVAMPAVHLPGWASIGLYTLCALLTIGFAAPFWIRPGFARFGFWGRVADCWSRPGQLLLALGAAFLFQLLLGVIYVLLGQALGLQVNFIFYFLLCPLVSLAAMAPFSINGLGVREAALAALFPLVGVGADRAIAFGLAWSATVMLADLFGGLALVCVDADPAEERGMRDEE